MSGSPLCEQAEFMLLGAVGREVREVFARHKLTRAQVDKVLAALLANGTILGRRQDEWPEAGKNTLDLVYGYILAAMSRQQAVLAEAPVRGHA
jgi:hypothetical protein